MAKHCKKRHNLILNAITFLAPKGSTGDKMDDTISPPVAALLKNQNQDNLLEDLSPIGGSSPGNCQRNVAAVFFGRISFWAKKEILKRRTNHNCIHMVFKKLDESS